MLRLATRHARERTRGALQGDDGPGRQEVDLRAGDIGLGFREPVSWVQLKVHFRHESSSLRGLGGLIRRLWGLGFVRSNSFELNLWFEGPTKTRQSSVHACQIWRELPLYSKHHVKRCPCQNKHYLFWVCWPCHDSDCLHHRAGMDAATVDVLLARMLSSCGQSCKKAAAQPKCLRPRSHALTSTKGTCETFNDKVPKAMRLPTTAGNPRTLKLHVNSPPEGTKPKGSTLLGFWVLFCCDWNRHV